MTEMSDLNGDRKIGSLEALMTAEGKVVPLQKVGKEDLMELQEALRRYALDHGAAATNALIIESATDADLAKIAPGLIGLKREDGRPLGLGEATAAGIVRAVGKLMEEVR